MLPKEFMNIGASRVEMPKAAELIKHFEGFMDLCKENHIPPSKMLFISYLGVTRQVYQSWSQDKQNKYLSNEEFLERMTVIKKMEELFEAELSNFVMTAAKPTGAIFTAKAQYNWDDRGNGEADQGIKITGYLMPADATKPPKTDEE